MRPRFLRGSDRVRFVCTDSTAQPEEPRDPTTTFGGVGQFVLGPPGLLRGPLPTDFVRGPRGEAACGERSSRVGGPSL